MLGRLSSFPVGVQPLLRRPPRTPGPVTRRRGDQRRRASRERGLLAGFTDARSTRAAASNRGLWVSDADTVHRPISLGSRQVPSRVPELVAAREGSMGLRVESRALAGREHRHGGGAHHLGACALPISCSSASLARSTSRTASASCASASGDARRHARGRRVRGETSSADVSRRGRADRARRPVRSASAAPRRGGLIDRAAIASCPRGPSCPTSFFRFALVGSGGLAFWVLFCVLGGFVPPARAAARPPRRPSRSMRAANTVDLARWGRSHGGQRHQKRRVCQHRCQLGSCVVCLYGLAQFTGPCLTRPRVNWSSRLPPHEGANNENRLLSASTCSSTASTSAAWPRCGARRRSAPAASSGWSRSSASCRTSRRTKSSSRCSSTRRRSPLQLNHANIAQIFELGRSRRELLHRDGVHPRQGHAGDLRSLPQEG